jgi:hypothetical protein
MRNLGEEEVVPPDIRYYGTMAELGQSGSGRPRSQRLLLRRDQMFSGTCRGRRKGAVRFAPRECEMLFEN